MKCELPHIKAIDNTRAFLKEIEVLGDNDVILNRPDFIIAANQLSKESLSVYGIGTPLWEVNPANPLYAIPNDLTLSSIDRVKRDMNISGMFYKKAEEPIIDQDSDIPLKLRDILIKYVKKLNPEFKIEVLDNLLKTHGVIGIANFKDFKIQLQRGQEKKLPEEVAHFLIELLPNEHSLKQRILDEAPRTRLYKSVYKEYRDLYGNDITRLKTETAAKLVSFYLTDKELFKHWSGSDSLIDNLIKWIKDFLKWLRGNKQLNSFIEAANKIVNLDISGIRLERAQEIEDMYSISEYMTKVKILESLNNLYVGKFDHIYINLNDTILDYQGYPGSPKDKFDMLFGFNPSTVKLRDDFYKTVKLTSLGKEISDKIKFIGSSKVTFFTKMVVNDVLRARLMEEFGNINIERIEIASQIVDENTGQLLGEIEQNSLAELLNRDNSQFPLVIDNSIRTLDIPHTFARFNSRRSLYTPLETRLRREREKQDRDKKELIFIQEMQGIDKNTVISKVARAFEIIRRELENAEKTERLLSQMGEEEVSNLFRDKYGNITLPLSIAESATKLIAEATTYEQGLIEFLATIEATTRFFKDRNDTKFLSLKELIDSGESSNIERAIQELYAISKMGTDWQNYIKEFQKLLKDIPDTTTVDTLLGDLDVQISRTKLIALDLSNKVISEKLSPQFKIYNLNIESQIEEFEKSLLTATETEKERINERITELRSQIKTPSDIFKVLTGEEKDINNLTVWIKTLHNSGDPLIGSIGRLMQKSFAEVELEVLQRSQDFGHAVSQLLQEYTIDEREVQEVLISPDTVMVYDAETEKMVPKPSLSILNPFQNLYLLDVKHNELEEQLSLLTEDTEENKISRNKLRTEFESWLNENWHRPYTESYYTRYNNLKNTEEDIRIFNMVQSIQREKYRQIEDISTLLQSETDSEGRKEKLKDIQRIRTELKYLKRDVYFDGSPKIGDDLSISKMLVRKGEIDREFNEYISNDSKFKTEFTILLNTLSLDNDVRQNLEILLNKGDSYSELYVYAKQNAPFEVVEWLDDNTIVRYSDNWYLNRSKILEGIDLLSKEINSEMGMQGVSELKDKWLMMTTLTSPLRDEDNILDGSITTPVIQKKVLEYEKKIEEIKRIYRENVQDAYPEIKEKRKQLRELVGRLYELQNKSVTDAYIDQFITLASNSGFMQEFNKLHPSEQFNENSDLLKVINSQKFKNFIKDRTDSFSEWFNDNHFEKSSIENYEEVRRLYPTYIWLKIEPNSSDDILTLPNFQYSTRAVKKEFQTEKLNWITWNPITKKYLPKSIQFFNPAYLNLMQDASRRGEGLRKILKLISDFHIKTQENPLTPREAKIGFGLPYIAKRDLETTEYFKNIYNNFIVKTNRFEKGEANYDETEENITLKQRVISWFNGLVGKTKEEEVRHYHRIAVPYTHYMEPDKTSRDLLLTTIMFAGSTSKAQRMLKESRLFSLIEESLLSSNLKVGENASNKNRYTAFRFAMDHNVYGMNKQYELGKPLDRGLMLLRKGNTFGTLGLPIGFANTIKNNLQGRLQNIIGNKFGNWSDNTSMSKAGLNFNTNFIRFLSEIEKPADKRNIDYHILTFFNPDQVKQGELVLKGGSGRIIQERSLLLFNQGMEFSISANLLYGHLYYQKVKGESGDIKSLYDILEIKENKLNIKKGYKDYLTGREVDMDYLIDTKLSYRTVMEYVQGRVDGKTLLSTYTIGQTLLYFKNWMIPMLRRRFDKSNPNYIIGENLEGYWRTFGRLSYRMFSDLIKEGKLYWNTYTEAEKRNYITTLNEIAFVIISSLLIGLIFGFDSNDPDKYKKLRENSYAENLALLMALQAKSETETLTMMPFFNVESQIVPPLFTESIRLVKNPTTGFSIIENTSKTIDAFYGLIMQKPNAYYSQDMPAFNIEKGDSKAMHYLMKVAQIDKFLYATQNPEGKIQAFISNIKR